jgi:hypothetical protein
MDTLRAGELGRFVKPGQFFDFTRYRPTVHYSGEQRVFTLPNSTINYARLSEEQDLLFFNMLEPHAFTEEYIESIVKLLETLGVRRYCRVGAWYGAVPHTRQLPIGYFVDGQQVDLRTGRRILQTSRYEGPTSAMSLLTEELEKLGIENVSLLLQLPYYAKLEEDYTGVGVILEAMSKLYDLPSELAGTILNDKSHGERQYSELSATMADDPVSKDVIQQLEAARDAEEGSSSDSDDSPPLSPEIERFLGELTDRMESGDLDV